MSETLTRPIERWRRSAEAAAGRPHVAGAWPATFCCLLLSLPYLLSLNNFFASDDWVHLSFSRAISPWQVWRYFTPHVIWFYRPLQAWQFGWLCHLFGLRPLAFNVSLLVMHLGVCALVYLLACRLTTRRGGLLVTVLFAAQWLCSNVMLWCSNTNTLQCALVTLALCLTFLGYLDQPGRSRWMAVCLLLVLDLLTKESAVIAPLLLAALWWWHAGNSQSRGSSSARALDVTATLGPFFLLTAGYLLLHHCLVRDAYDGYVKVGYQLAPPTRAIRQALFSFNFSLLSFYQERLLLPMLPPLRAAVTCFVEHLFILPFVLAGAAWWRRDRALMLGVLWIFICLAPTAGLVAFQMYRFFYLPGFGAALILARLGQWSWQSASLEIERQKQSGGIAWRLAAARVARAALPVSLAYLLLINLAVTTSACLRDRGASDRAGAAFRDLRAASGRLPRGSLLVLRNLPGSYFIHGMGVSEMVRLALQDPGAEAILESQRLLAPWCRRLDRYPVAYLAEFSPAGVTLRCIRDARWSATSAVAIPEPTGLRLPATERQGPPPR